jgi:hypothetical protein
MRHSSFASSSECTTNGSMQQSTRLTTTHSSLAGPVPPLGTPPVALPPLALPALPAVPPLGEPACASFSTVRRDLPHAAKARMTNVQTSRFNRCRA